MKKISMIGVAVFFALFLMSVQHVHAGPQDPAPISGKVVETMNSGGYTYVCLEHDGRKTWIAVPEMKVAKGQKMSFEPGTEMTNFESKTLKRKFEKIVFSAGPVK